VQQERPRVILFGDSLILAGMKVSLGSSAELDLIALGRTVGGFDPKME